MADDNRYELAGIPYGDVTVTSVDNSRYSSTASLREVVSDATAQRFELGIRFTGGIFEGASPKLLAHALEYRGRSFEMTMPQVYSYDDSLLSRPVNRAQIRFFIVKSAVDGKVGDNTILITHRFGEEIPEGYFINIKGKVYYIVRRVNYSFANIDFTHTDGIHYNIGRTPLFRYEVYPRLIKDSADGIVGYAGFEPFIPGPTKINVYHGPRNTSIATTRGVIDTARWQFIEKI